MPIRIIGPAQLGVEYHSETAAGAVLAWNAATRTYPECWHSRHLHFDPVTARKPLPRVEAPKPARPGIEAECEAHNAPVRAWDDRAAEYDDWGMVLPRTYQGHWGFLRKVGGRWGGCMPYECSMCGHGTADGLTRFCPSCGCEIKGVAD